MTFDERVMPDDGTRGQILRHAWEQRAGDGDRTLQTVLLKGLGARLNAYIDDWQTGVMRQQVLNHLPENSRLLDIGCGYGRLADRVVQLRPDVRVVGVDFALPFCRAFQTAGFRDAACADLTAMPFRGRVADAALVVTVLMYVPAGRVVDTLRGVSRLVKPGGRLLLIDATAEVARWMWMFGARSTPTSGRAFSTAEYAALPLRAGLSVAASGGIPAFTMSLPFLRALEARPHLQAALLRRIAWLDRVAGRASRYSLQRWMTAIVAA